MAIPSSLTLNYDAVLSTTLFNYRDTLEDNITTSNFFYYFMKKKQEGGFEEVEDIGDRMMVPLRYQNGQADSYSGYDILDVDPMDGITAAFWDWRQCAVPVTISGLEEKKNKGKAKVVSLLSSKIEQAEDGIIEYFGKSFLQGNGPNTATQITTPRTSQSNGSVFLDPLPKLIAYDPTASVTVGNIPQGTNTFWRNQTKTSAATTYAGFLKELRNSFNNCSKGPGGGPNMHIVDQATSEYYEAALAASHRNPSYQKADIPFDAVGFRGYPVVWDEFMPNWYGGTITQSTSQGSWVMMNSKFIRIKVHKSTNFTSTPFQTPENQDAKVSHILWLGGVGMSSRRKHGVVVKIDTTVAS